MTLEKDELEKSPTDGPVDGAQSDKAEPTIFIDPEKERKIVRKFDMLVLPQFVLIIVLAYLDRTNIGNARMFGFEETLNLKNNEFGNVSSVFYATYVAFELPWVLAMRRWGANAVLAAAIVGWSAVVIGTGFIHNYSQAVVSRLLLGLMEAGLFPALTFVISTIYPRESQGKRVAVLYGATAISGAFGGLIAYGIQLMGDRHGLEAWRWLFIIEGIISFVVGVICWGSLPTSAEAAWFLKEDERQLMRDRRVRDIVYTGDEEFSSSYVWMAFSDPVIWVASIGLFCAGVPMFGFGIFLPTIIRGFGYDALGANYLTIPVYIFACIILGAITYFSDRLRKRAAVLAFVPPIVIVGYAIALGTPNPGAGFFAMFLCAGVYSYNSILAAWVSNNIKPDHKRSAAIPLLISIGNISGVVSSQVYPATTAPRYILGNAVSLAMEFAAGCCIVIVYLMLRRRNQVKAKQRSEGVTDNGEKGDKSLDFEYIL